MAELTTDRETAVLVPVPEAERVVSPHRSRLDGAVALGVPAHVTVLFPSWFGEDVLYLAPRPDGPFRALTRAVCAAFPGYLPYGGAFADTIPHLTVGERERGGGRPAGEVAALRAAGRCPDAMKPDFQCVRMRWNWGFMALLRHCPAGWCQWVLSPVSARDVQPRPVS